jgi:transposase
MLFDAHTRSFTALGGIPRRAIYDNMKTTVDKVNKGRGRIFNARFAVMCAYYLFDADFCNVASGWEKGVVEKNVQDSRRRIWLDAQIGDLARSLSSMCGWASVAGLYGANCAIPSTSRSAWQKCWSWNAQR